MRGYRRKVSGALRAVVTTPSIVGALYVLGLAAWAGSRGAGDDADLGDVRRAEALATFIERRFAGEITRMKVAIVATAIGTGLAVGLVAELVLYVRNGARGLARRSAPRAVLETVLVVAAVHAILVLWSMADSPQLYAARWYARGGLVRTVQVFVTDVLGARGAIALGFLSLLLYVRPSRLVYLAHRVAWAARKPALVVASAVSAATARAMAKVASALAIAVAVATSWEATPVSAAPAQAPVAASSGVAANPTTGPTTATTGPNILLIAADSLRADRIDARVAPTFAGLAARGTRFDRAYVSMPRTFPSWVTILSGRHGHRHGVRSMFPTWEERAKDFDALPQRLARAGYTTGVVSDYAGDIFGRVDLGFERVDTPSFDFRQLIRQRAVERETPLLPLLHSQLGRRIFPVMRELNDAADPMLLAEDAVAALRRTKGQPFFLTVFFSTAHFPYAAPAPYYAKYTDPAYRGRFKYHKPVGLASEAPPDAGDVRQIRALYDGAVTAIDDAAARILRSLDEMGLAKNTIVVVTSDHGETLYDHEHGQGHGDHLFGDEGTHVPLVVYDPRIARAPAGGRREARVVRDVDIAPTLYEACGVTAPADLDGRSLGPALRGEPLGPKLAYAETELWFTEEIPGLSPELRIPYPGIMGLTELDARHNAEIVLRRDVLPLTLMARHRMVRDERYKLIYVPTRRSVKYMLFDTQTDPGETHDVAAAHPQETMRLRAELWTWMLSDPLMDQKDGFLVPRDGAFARGKGKDAAP